MTAHVCGCDVRTRHRGAVEPGGRYENQNSIGSHFQFHGCGAEHEWRSPNRQTADLRRHPTSSNSAGVEGAALDLLPSGIGIFGKDFKLVYANRSFRDLRFLPERLCIPGTPLEDIVRHIATRGDYGVGDVDTLVKDRMAETLTPKPWNAEQDIEGRRRLAIRHTPLPGLGLMITYADVTETRVTERKLRENEERYSRVSEAVAEGDLRLERCRQYPLRV